MFAQITIAVAVPAVFIAHAVVCGIHKDGSPFRKDWWTA